MRIVGNSNCSEIPNSSNGWAVGSDPEGETKGIEARRKAEEVRKRIEEIENAPEPKKPVGKITVVEVTELAISGHVSCDGTIKLVEVIGNVYENPELLKTK